MVKGTVMMVTMASVVEIIDPCRHFRSIRRLHRRFHILSSDSFALAVRWDPRALKPRTSGSQDKNL